MHPAATFQIDQHENFWEKPAYKQLRNQFRAVMRKNTSLQMRQRKTLLCQVVFPIVLIVFIAGMQSVVNTIIPHTADHLVVEDRVQSYPQSFGYTASLDYYFRAWIVDETEGQVAGTLYPNNTKSGLLGNIAQYSYINPSWPNVTNAPFFEAKQSAEQAQQDIENYFSYLNHQSAHHIASSYLLYESPDAVIVLHDANLTTGNLRYDVMYSDNLVYTRREHMNIQTKARFELTSMIHAINSAFLEQANGTTVTAFTQAYPYWDTGLSFNLNDIVNPMLVPFALAFLIPVFMHTIILEKENRLREMMKMMGMRMSTYWLINYIFDYLMYVIVSAVFIGLQYIIQVRMFTQTSFLVILVLFGVWGHTQVSLSFFLSAFFNKTAAGSIMGYLIIVLSVITGVVLNQFLYALPEVLPWAYYVWPLFLFERAVYILSANCAGYHCVQFSSLFSLDNELTRIIVALAVQAVAFLFVAIYLDRILPKQYGISDSPLFCLPSMKSCAKSCKEYELCEEEYDEEANMNDIDADVLAERKRVHTSTSSSAILIKDLKKQYDTCSGLARIRCRSSSALALKGLNLVIESDQCLGLLGPNGAGKTTLISILTGLYPPTSGSAVVYGHDISTNLSEIRKMIGVCPQFDIQWDALTPLDHVLFYTRIKGIPAHEEFEHAMALLTHVGLQADATRKSAGQLSGGMRRRLSVAMALAGDPKIVYLDEPTSGLDPSSRRQLWDIISASKKDRSIILTTHSMEEADILCNRIAIIAKGTMQCIGTPLHLKNKFGHGYRLLLTAEAGKVSMVQKFMSESVSGVEMVEVYDNLITYNIPTELQNPVRLSRLFTLIEAEKAQHHIANWGLTQTSMEDVFLSIINKNHIE